jgi:hypothetical protein
MNLLHRMHSKKTILTAAMALTLAASAAEVHAATNWATSGTVCNPTNSSQISQSGYNANGIHNLDSGFQLPVSCGVTTIQGIQMQNVTVKVLDRNSAEDLTCTLFTYNNNGDPVFVSTAHTPTGWNSPAMTSIGFTPLGGATSGVDLECTLPRATGSGVSHVASIRYSMP